MGCAHCDEAMLQAVLHPTRGYLLLEWQPQADAGLLDAPGTERSADPCR